MSILSIYKVASYQITLMLDLERHKAYSQTLKAQNFVFCTETLYKKGTFLSRKSRKRPVHKTLSYLTGVKILKQDIFENLASLIHIIIQTIILHFSKVLENAQLPINESIYPLAIHFIDHVILFLLSAL